MTCAQRGYRAKAASQRETWVPLVRAHGTDVFFFLGKEGQPRCADEIILDAPDDYAGIPLKVKAIMRWAAERKYDYVSKCDDDVYVVPRRYEALKLHPYDYIGRFRGPCGIYPAHFASGFFYSLSLKAAVIVGAAPWHGDWMDERHIANTLAANGIYGHTDPGSYLVTGPFHPPVDLLRQNVAQRSGTAYCQYGPDGMREMHACFWDASPVPATYLHAAPRPRVTFAQAAARPTDEIPVEKRNRG